MDYSLPAWLGALVGTIAAVALYVPAIRYLDRRHARGAQPGRRRKIAKRSRRSCQLRGV